MGLFSANIFGMKNTVVLILFAVIGAVIAGPTSLAHAAGPLSLRNRHITLTAIEVDVHRISAESRLRLKALSSAMPESQKSVHKVLKAVQEEIESLPTLKAQCSEESLTHNVTMRGSAFLNDDALFEFRRSQKYPCQALTLRNLRMRLFDVKKTSDQAPIENNEVRVAFAFDEETERDAVCELKAEPVAFGLLVSARLTCSLTNGEGTLQFELD